MRDLLLASARDGDKAEETRNGVGTAVSVTRQWTRVLVRRMTHTLTKWKAVVQSCTTKQIIDVPFSRIRKETGEDIKVVPQDRISDCITERGVDVAVPEIQEQDVEEVKHIAQELMRNRAVEQLKGQIIDVLVPQIMSEIDEVVKLVLRERVQQQHVAERVVDALLRWTHSGQKYRDEAEAKIEAENDVETCVLWVQERIIEEIVDVLVPQAMKDCVEAVKLVPQDEAQNRALEETVAVPVPEGKCCVIKRGQVYG